MPIRCIAIEDEPPALEKLTQFICRVPQLQLIGSFDRSIDAIAGIQSLRPELLFLDIQMESLTGLQLLDTLQYRPQVIFTTAYSEYALRGYEYCATDYLLKPYSFERFMQAVQKVRQPEMSSAAQDFIFVKSDYRIVKIQLSEILYVEGMRDFRCIHTVSEKILTSVSYIDLETMLPELMFQRVHKSFMVSLQKIDKVEHHRIYIGNKIIPVGDVYKERFYLKLRVGGK